MRHIIQKLAEHAARNALRSLQQRRSPIGFYSNDYISFSTDVAVSRRIQALANGDLARGSTDSRLLSGNLPIFDETGQYIADFQHAEATLLYNSGYDASVGFFSCIMGRGDVILHNSYSHAPIHDGTPLSLANACKFKHNDLGDLEKLLKKFATDQHTVLVTTGTVFSMNGNSPDLRCLVALAQRYEAYVTVDKAHTIRVFGSDDSGLIQVSGLENNIFARVVTLGKGLGVHEAAVVASVEMVQYLINFSRSFIYTTTMSPHSVATIRVGYERLSQTEAISQLHSHTSYFKAQVAQQQLRGFIALDSAIRVMVVPGDECVKTLAAQLQAQGIGVLPILASTVPAGEERLRTCLHSFSTEEEIKRLINLLTDKFIS